VKESLHSMLAPLLAIVLSQQAVEVTPRRALEERVLSLEEQGRRARVLRTFGLITLIGAGLGRETRSTFAGLQQYFLFHAIRGEEFGERGYRQLADAQVVAWIVTAALVAGAALFFGIGYGSDPIEELAAAKADLARVSNEGGGSGKNESNQ